MEVAGTELEYTESDAVALDFYLGGDAEDKDAWAKRVWDKCAEYKTTNGLGLDGKGMPSVYGNSPQDLWENKKKKRREALCKDLETEDLADNAILALKEHPKYSKRGERDRLEREKQEEDERKAREHLVVQVDKLRSKGFDDETIKIIYPRSQGILNEV